MNAKSGKKTADGDSTHTWQVPGSNLAMSHMAALSVLHTHTQTLLHAHTLSLSLTHTHTHTFFLNTLSLLHTHSLSYTYTLSYTHSLSLSDSAGAGKQSGDVALGGPLSDAQTLSETLSHTYSLKKTLLPYTHTHTHTHTDRHSPRESVCKRERVKCFSSGAGKQSGDVALGGPLAVRLPGLREGVCVGRCRV